MEESFLFMHRIIRIFYCSRVLCSTSEQLRGRYWCSLIWGSLFIDGEVYNFYYTLNIVEGMQCQGFFLHSSETKGFLDVWKNIVAEWFFTWNCESIMPRLYQCLCRILSFFVCFCSTLECFFWQSFNVWKTKHIIERFVLGVHLLVKDKPCLQCLIWVICCVKSQMFVDIWWSS